MEAVAEIKAVVKNVPVLRFPEFEGEWVKRVFTDLVKVIDCKHRTPPYVEEGIPVVSPGSINWGEIDLVTPKKRVTMEEYESLMDHCSPDVGDMVFSRNQSIGIASILYRKEKFVLGQDTVLIQAKKADPFFIYFRLQTHPIQSLISRLSGGSTFSRINLKDVRELIMYVSSSRTEQQRIGSFLTAVEEKILQLSKEKALLEKYKKGVMQQIFSQQIRFKDDNGNEFPEWKEKKFGQVFERIKTKNAENNKNVLTISAQQGLVNQEDYFNKSVSAENVTGYYLLHKSDFAYNKSYSKGYPMGAIKRLTKYDKGVVSTLYICFKIKDGSSEEYFEQYFNSGFLNSELHKIAQEGARNHGLLNMSVVEFFNDIKLPRPSEEEQFKIANFLTSIDNKINYTSKHLEQAQQFKKGLLQQMFV